MAKKLSLVLAVSSLFLLPSWNFTSAFQEKQVAMQIEKSPILETLIPEAFYTSKMKRLEKKAEACAIIQKGDYLDTEIPAFKNPVREKEEEDTLKKTIKKSKRFVDEVYKTTKDVPYEKERIFAVIYAESEGNKFATSRSGARGLMQIIKRTWRWMETNKSFDKYAYEPILNIKTGIKILKWSEDYCKKNYPYWDILKEEGKVKVVSACYNAGQGTLEEKDWNLSKTSKRTRDYSAKLLWAYKKLKENPILLN